MEFANGGVPQTKLEVVGDAPKGRTGTTVPFWPDGSLFETPDFSARTILQRIQMMDFLHKGLEIRFTSSEGRRVGTACVHTDRSRSSPYHSKYNTPYQIYKYIETY